MLGKTLQNLPVSRPYLAIILISVVLFFPTWQRLFALWLEFEQVLAHGLATGLIFVGLVLIHPPAPVIKSDIATRTITDWFDRLGGFFLLAVTLVWTLLELVRIDTLAFLTLPVGMGTIAWTFLGFRQAVRFIPYLLLLSLSLPIWADLVPYLVELASVVVGKTVHLFGMTALIEGNNISLPYGRLVIADGCSGIRYFAIAILLAMMTSILNDARWKGWLLTLSIAALLGLLANWVRIIIIVVAAYRSNMTSSLVTDHELMGWLVFAAFVLPALYFSPVRKRLTNSHDVTRPSLKKGGAIFAGIAFLIGPVAIGFAGTGIGGSSPWRLAGPDMTVAASSGLPLSLSYPERLEQQVWRNGQVWISLAQTTKHSAQDKLVPYFRSPVNTEDWYLEETRASGAQLYRNRYTRKQVLIVQWFQVGHYRADSYLEAKLLQIPATLSRYQRFAVVTLQISCGMRTCGDHVQTLENTERQIRLETSKTETSD